MVVRGVISCINIDFFGEESEHFWIFKKFLNF